MGGGGGENISSVPTLVMIAIIKYLQNWGGGGCSVYSKHSPLYITFVSKIFQKMDCKQENDRTPLGFV